MERRGFLGMFAGIPLFKHVKSVETLEMGDKDILVLSYDTSMNLFTEEVQDRLVVYLKKKLGHERFMIIPDTLEMKVLRRGPGRRMTMELPGGERLIKDA